MPKLTYYQIITETDRVQVGDEITFDDVLDYMGRIQAVAKVGAVLAERNLVIDVKINNVLTAFFVQERGANPAPTFTAPSNS